MGRRQPVLERVRISDIGSEGNAVARVNDMVVFVPMLIPGDVVDIKVTRRRKQYLFGRVIHFHEYSSDRIEPRCTHFGVCGGCRWQHLPYNLQLKHKEKQVKDNLLRIGKRELPEINSIIGSEKQYLYRNKMEYTFSNRRWLTGEEVKSGKTFKGETALGLHIPGYFDRVLNIEECHLQEEPSNRIRNAVREFALRNDLDFFDIKRQEGLLRNLIIRNSYDGEIMVIVVFFRNEMEKITCLLDFTNDRFPEITSLMYIINSKKNDSIADQKPLLYRGKDHITERMGELKFRVGPKSFYQTNREQAYQLYRVVRSFAGLSGKELVCDLYTGTGTIANFIAGDAERVTGVESVEEAVRDAKVNSDINGIGNTYFFTGDAREALTEEFMAKYGRPDVVVADPPRAGMHADVLDALERAAPRRIVYVSCNPATQARDISLMSCNYYVSAVQPVDMFPHTHHVENVILLEKKEE